jgi:hypothetical protein
LDDIISENQIHRVRKQRNILLPSGGRRIGFYRNPEKYGGKDRIIPIPDDTLNELLAQYDKPDPLLFGSREQVTWCEEIHTAIGAPKLSARGGWGVFSKMITLDYYIENSDNGY